MTDIKELDFLIFDLLTVNDIVKLHYTKKPPEDYKHLLDNNNYLCKRLNKEVSFSCDQFRSVYINSSGRIRPIDIFIKHYTLNGKITFGSERYNSNYTYLLIESIKDDDSELIKYFLELVIKNISNKDSILSHLEEELNLKITPQTFLIIYDQWSDDKPTYINITYFSRVLHNYSTEIADSIAGKIITTRLFREGMNVI